MQKLVDDLRSLALCMWLLGIATTAVSAQDEFRFNDATQLFPLDSEHIGMADNYVPNYQDSVLEGSTCECCSPDQFGYDGGCGVSSCSSGKPCLEQIPGRSLFWQDSYSTGYRHEEPLFHDSRRARIYGSVESVWLSRNSGSSRIVPLLSTGPIRSGELETEFEDSLRSSIGLALGDWYRIDFSWLGQVEWTDRLAGTNGNQTERIDFTSQLKSAEINLRRRVRIHDWPKHYPDYWNSFELSTLLGFRHVDIDEKTSYRSQGPLSTTSVSANSANKMSGVQLGALGQWLYEDRGWLDMEVKGAILSNDLTVSTAPNVFQSDESRTAFLIDASLMCNYQVSQCFTLKLGYNMIWVTGTALATENASTSSVPLLAARHEGETLYHGPSIGIVFAR